MKLDHARKITHVFGRQPLRYLQDGHGFDGAERYLGRFNAQGEPLDEGRSETKAPEGAASLDELSIKELKAMAKEAGIAGSANMNKAALVEAITDATDPAGDEGRSEDEDAA